MKKNKRKDIMFNILMLFGIFMLFNIIMSTASAKKEIFTSDYTINQNETIWNLASEICNKNSDKDLNIQNVIIEIKKVNNLKDSNIYVGQTIKLPVY